ncbi:MAG: cytidylate kinase-like family protein [Lachnospiraceae bacterium]|nr:cytidylate kinase-like family protein [Lachnospiraceae bacterium]
MKNMVVTIARQYGSGGKTIGEMLANDLGIPCYGRQIIKFASEDSGISEQIFSRFDEKLDMSLFKKLTKNIYSGRLLSPESSGFVSDQNLFNYQAKIIKSMAEEGSCIIIGRCADFVLRDYENVASVFVHADEDFLMEMAMERNSMTEREMKRYIEKVNRHRSDFYRHYTGCDWSDARNYDLCLNSGKLGFARCVEEIKSYLKIRFEK